MDFEDYVLSEGRKRMMSIDVCLGRYKFILTFFYMFINLRFNTIKKFFVFLINWFYVKKNDLENNVLC